MEGLSVVGLRAGAVLPGHDMGWPPADPRDGTGRGRCPLGLVARPEDEETWATQRNVAPRVVDN